MARFFLAINPPESLQQEIDALRGKWGHPHHRVEPHITTKIPFEWDGSPELFLKPLAEACSRVAPFVIKLGEPHRFPQAQVLYLAVEGEGPKALHVAVIDALAGLVPTDSRRHEGETYTPHLTLAVGRFGIDSSGLEAMEREIPVQLGEMEPFTVSALRSYQWDARLRGWNRYKEIPLGG